MAFEDGVNQGGLIRNRGDMLGSVKKSAPRVMGAGFASSRAGPLAGFGFGAAPNFPPPPPSSANVAFSAPVPVATAGGAATSTPTSSSSSSSSRSVAATASKTIVPQKAKSAAESSDVTVNESGGFDFTRLPVLLDQRYEQFDLDSALRPTIINPANTWTKTSQKALLAAPATTTLSAADLEKEKNAAFDLLEALSKSGALSIDCASLHVVIAATHCFDNTLMNTIVQNNLNPIERMERSALIMAATLHRLPVEDIVEPAQLSRVQSFNPQLMRLESEKS